MLWSPGKVEVESMLVVSDEATVPYALCRSLDHVADVTRPRGSITAVMSGEAGVNLHQPHRLNLLRIGSCALYTTGNSSIFGGYMPPKIRGKPPKVTSFWQ
jgi:hypothetical protein